MNTTSRKPHSWQQATYAGLILSCAFGDIRRLSNQPMQGTVCEPSPQDIPSLNGSREGPNPSQAPEQETRTWWIAPNFYNLRVDQKGAGGSAYAMKRSTVGSAVAGLSVVKVPATA